MAAETRSDPLGVASLILGIMAVVSLVLVFCTCGISLVGTGILAVIGFGLAFGATGNLRAAGFTLNLVAIAAVLLFAGMAYVNATVPAAPTSRSGRVN